jgi:uncharacterized protein (DUF2252 family)
MKSMSIVFCAVLLAPGVQAKPSGRKAARLEQRLLSDNDFLRRTNPAAMQRKFEVKMKVSPFVYFRGTAMRFDHRLRKQDRQRPHVLGNGDVHPLNFGVMRVGSRLRWVANDQDEAHRAPYTWDLKRGAVGFELMAAEHGLSKGKRRKVVRAFVDAYLARVDELTRSTGPSAGARPPKLIRELLASARQAEQRPHRFYAKYLAPDGGFIRRDRYTPVAVGGELRRTFGRYLRNLSGERPDAARELAGYRITGAAIKETNGVGSMGLSRYLLALGRADGAGTPLILELKQQRAPALASYVGGLAPATDHGRRVHLARQRQTGGGERFDGHTTHGGVSYQVMTVGPYQLDLGDLDRARLGKKHFRQLARGCGVALAEAHLQWTGHGRAGAPGRRLGQQILADARRTGHLDEQIARFAHKTAGKVTREHETFRWLLEHGAFGL